VRFKTGAKISGAPTGHRKKLIFGGGALPHRQKSIKERHLYDGSLAFTPKLKRTHRHFELVRMESQKMRMMCAA
jgi:hypothetical protein